jgi:hypothetical protein
VDGVHKRAKGVYAEKDGEHPEELGVSRSGGAFLKSPSVDIEVSYKTTNGLCPGKHSTVLATILNFVMAFPSLVIFGPQTTWPSAEYLSQIRHVLLNEPCLSVFLDAVRDLPNLWPTLVEANPGLNRVPGGQLLNDIKRWVDKGDFSHVSESPPNVLSTPLTIIVHVVQYLHYVRNIGPGTSHAHILDSINTGGVQGFSTGFLTATALACSKEEKDVNIYGAVALRLAVCIGAFVDLDGIFAEPPNETSCLVVRWTKEFSVPQLLHILKNYPEVSIPCG